VIFTHGSHRAGCCGTSQPARRRRAPHPDVAPRPLGAGPATDTRDADEMVRSRPPQTVHDSHVIVTNWWQSLAGYTWPFAGAMPDSEHRRRLATSTAVSTFTSSTWETTPRLSPRAENRKRWRRTKFRAANWTARPQQWYRPYNKVMGAHPGTL